MAAPPTARFIAVEGDDGVGKSTQAGRLTERLRAAGHRVVATREPGGTGFGERVRALVLGAESPVQIAEALLFAAARAQLVAEVIRPALDRGELVVCDRFVDSSVVYQGILGGLGVERVERLNAWATGGCNPDLVVVLELDPAVAMARAGAGGDRFDRAGHDYHAAVAQGFRRLAARAPDRYALLEAHGSADEVAARVWAALAARVAT